MENKEIKVKVKERFEIEAYRAIKYHTWQLTELSGGAALISVESRDSFNVHNFYAYKEGRYFAKFRNFDIVNVVPGEEVVYTIIVERV